ncbi:MAG: CPBP family intramembrane metalloprotease [Bacteroidales bacterium]|nr:CPBP family intramembrane metalloprotease [Bacteroidales bacterium]
MLNWHVIPVFLSYPVWGVMQQFMMLGLLAGNLISIKKTKLKSVQVIFITSLIFSIVHYPDLSLMMFTFLMQLVFTAVYLKWRNLWALGLAHGWIATFLLFIILKRDLWVEFFAWF